MTLALGPLVTMLEPLPEGNLADLNCFSKTELVVVPTLVPVVELNPTPIAEAL